MNSELETLLRSILKEELKPLQEGQQKLEDGQQALVESQHKLEGGQQALVVGQRKLEVRQQKLESGQHRLEERQILFQKAQEKSTQEIKNLQGDIRELSSLMKHQTSLLIENSTEIRKDIRITIGDIRADVDLLFTEVEQIKRKTNKLEKNRQK